MGITMEDRAENIRPDDEKFKELLLYIAQRCEGDDTFGATKLNKILFFSDFWAYTETGSPITGHEYQRLDWGPAPRRLLPIQREMEDAHECAMARRQHYGRPQTRLIALREPDLSRFSGEEIAIVDRVISLLWNRTAVDVSDISHRFLGWKVAAPGETIPYETARLDTRGPLSEAQEAWADSLVAERERRALHD